MGGGLCPLLFLEGGGRMRHMVFRSRSGSRSFQRDWSRDSSIATVTKIHRTLAPANAFPPHFYSHLFIYFYLSWLDFFFFKQNWIHLSSHLQSGVFVALHFDCNRFELDEWVDSHRALIQLWTVSGFGCDLFIIESIASFQLRRRWWIFECIGLGKMSDVETERERERGGGRGGRMHQMAARYFQNFPDSKRRPDSVPPEEYWLFFFWNIKVEGSFFSFCFFFSRVPSFSMTVSPQTRPTSILWHRHGSFSTAVFDLFDFRSKL